MSLGLCLPMPALMKIFISTTTAMVLVTIKRQKRMTFLLQLVLSIKVNVGYLNCS
ncbi:Uncharacterised protein [Vibrio cholerae]|nr:Uncharacterised protein [Vibrio cholerae]